MFSYTCTFYLYNYNVWLIKSGPVNCFLISCVAKKLNNYITINKCNENFEAWVLSK